MSKFSVACMYDLKADHFILNKQLMGEANSLSAVSCLELPV